MAVSEGANCQQGQGHQGSCTLSSSMPVLWLVGVVRTSLQIEGHIFKGMKNAKTIAVCQCGVIGRRERWRKEIFSMFTLIINSLQLSNCIFCFYVFWLHAVFLYAVQACATNTFSSSYRWQCSFSPSAGSLVVVTVNRNKDIRGLVLLSSYFPWLLFVVWLR